MPKRNRKNDFLAGHGMSPTEQFVAERQASAVPVSDLEGEFEGPGTYTSRSASLLQRKAWESRMRKEMGE